MIFKHIKLSLGYSSVKECLPHMHKTPGLIPVLQEGGKEKKMRKNALILAASLGFGAETN